MKKMIVKPVITVPPIIRAGSLSETVARIQEHETVPVVPI
jgi:hypothetical protein